MDATPVVSVILCVRNGASTLMLQLDALSREVSARTSWELLVVDNGSTDGTQQMVRSWLADHPEVVGNLVDGAALRGLAAARNLGASMAQGEYLLFCDADDEVQAGWVDAHAVALTRWDMAGGPLDTRLLNRPEVRAMRSALWPPDGTCLHHNATTGLSSPVGANMSVRAAAYREVGGCDEQLVVASDDLDLCWRIRLAGLSIGEAPDAVVAYRFREDLRGIARQFRGYGRGEAILRDKFRHQGLFPPLAVREEFRVAKWLATSLRTHRHPGPERADIIQRLNYRTAMWTTTFRLRLRRFLARK